MPRSGLRPHPKQVVPPHGIVKWGTRVQKKKQVALRADGLLCLLKTPNRRLDLARDNATSSPLLRLPAELRNKIFGFVLVSKRPLFIRGGHFYRGMNHLPHLKLLLVCRQIYNEARPIAYAENTFEFYWNNSLARFASWLQQGRREAVQRIQLVVPRWYDMYPPPATRFPNLRLITVFADPTRNAEFRHVIMSKLKERLLIGGREDLKVDIRDVGTGLTVG